MERDKFIYPFFIIVVIFIMYFATRDDIDGTFGRYLGKIIHFSTYPTFVEESSLLCD